MLSSSCCQQDQHHAISSQTAQNLYGDESNTKIPGLVDSIIIIGCDFMRTMYVLNESHSIYYVDNNVF